MKKPAPEQRPDDASRDRRPDFASLTSPEELVRGERTRDDFFDAALQLDKPATVEEIAELAGHGTDAAREYLDWFERMGIVVTVTESPATYRRNREYLTWRRVQRVRSEFEPEEILDALETESHHDSEYAEEFGVESPDLVSISEHAAVTDRAIEDVWESLSAWKTTRRRIDILERALVGSSDGAPDSRRSVA